MSIYEFNEAGIKPLQKTTFADRNIREWDIQQQLIKQIEIISDQTMVITDEFDGWHESRKRIDLLCIDKAADLVVIELKRTEDGGHMELQAIRYSAMVSSMTFDQVVETHKKFLDRIGSKDDAQDKILDFLEWNEPNEESFAQDVRIVLASADFSKELTCTVQWLNDKGIDIRCVKMEPLCDGQRTLLDVRQVIPLPETEQFQFEVRQKKQKEYQSRKSPRDFSKFTLSIGDRDYSNLNKRNLMYRLVREVIEAGAKPDELSDIRRDLFIFFDGELDEEKFTERLMESDTGGQLPKTKRYFCEQDKLFVVDGKTYAITNQWGNTTLNVAEEIRSNYPQLEISISSIN